jgi:gamma-glutamyl-gamma-aminobutyrate hydrolase PuuD
VTAARPPRIGITHGSEAPLEYERAVRAAGGDPFGLASDIDGLERDLDTLDALVLSGGPDVDPNRYGRPAHPSTRPASNARDEYEICLARAAFERNIPTLAICRGLQIANVAFGGTLHQHVPDIAGDIAHALPENSTDCRGLISEHVVDTVPGSRLSLVVGPSVVTGSRHHQAVDGVADRLRVVARTRDGIIEALELPDPRRFWLGVQWHPESTLDVDGGGSRAIFRALVDFTLDSGRR